MPKHYPISFERLYGGMTTDYFGFFCPKCHKEIQGIYLVDEGATPIYYAQIRCHECGDMYDFKLSKWIGDPPQRT